VRRRLDGAGASVASRRSAQRERGGPEVELVRREEFSAAHRLASPALSRAQNQALYGVCFRGHGHNYELEVAVRGRVDARTGMVMNLTDLMHLVRERIVARVDHRDLNRDVPFLRGVIPTAENVALAFWRELEPHVREFPGCRLHRIRLYESRSNVVEVLGRASSSTRRT
jgi:6-pyruvoyltetrahydropterin/6-carboxytetrahydropterin synthase